MKRFLSALLALLLLTHSALAASSWVNSDVEGGVAQQPRIQDDLNAAVNYQWLQTAQYPSGVMQLSAFSERAVEVREQIRGLLTGEPLTSDAGKLVQTMYDLYVDMEARNALAMKPVMPYVDAISAIETLEELTAYVLRSDVPFHSPYTTEVTTDIKNSDRRMVGLCNTDWLDGDPDEHTNPTEVGQRQHEGTLALLSGLLARVGYSEAEAAECAQRALAFEAKLSAHSFGTSARKQADYFAKLYHPVTMDELRKLSPSFPLERQLAQYTEAGVTTFVLYNPDELADINALYTEQNVPQWKDYLLCRTLRTCVQWLDQACVDMSDEYSALISGMAIHSLPEDTAYAMCGAALGMEMSQLFVENFVPASVKEDAAQIVSDVMGVFRKRLEDRDWMGDETRAFALEKLDNITVRVAYPDDWTPYVHEGLSLRGYAEGGDLIEASIAVGRNNHDKELRRVLDPIDHSQWNTKPMDTNAYYSAYDNSINILAGILGGDFYHADGSYEERLGTIGFIIGHEITHGFDTIGSQFDKSGSLQNWWTEADRAAFTQRTDKVKAYYSAIETLPGQFVDGQLTLCETVADLGGLSCVVELGSQKLDFDFQTFFKSFATVWRTKETASMAQYVLSLDTHAPGYLRTNVTAQQFDAFYTAFDVKEGDGMYLAPEERLRVW